MKILIVDSTGAPPIIGHALMIVFSPGVYPGLSLVATRPGRDELLIYFLRCPAAKRTMRSFDVVLAAPIRQHNLSLQNMRKQLSVEAFVTEYTV